MIFFFEDRRPGERDDVIDLTMMIIDRRMRTLVHLAYAKAHSSRIKRGKHCALILDKNYNVVVSFVNTGTIHAERGAVDLFMSSSLYSGDGFYTLLVVRAVTSTGEIGLSKPCANCENAIRNCSVINSVIFSCDRGQFGMLW